MKDSSKSSLPPMNLTELANQHLSSVIGVSSVSSKLFLPKLENGIGGNKNFIIPKLGLKQKVELEVVTSKNDSSKLQEEKDVPVIDLSSALLSSLALSSDSKEIVNEMHETRYVEKTEIVKLMKRLNLEDVNCQINSRHLLFNRVAIRVAKRSSLATIITRNYTMRVQPYSIRHIFRVTQKENMPQKFHFNTPSPDDLILRHLKKDGRRN